MRTRLILIAISMMCPIGRAADVDPDLSGYREIVGQYRSGDVAGAVRSVGSWSRPRLLKTARKLWHLKESERRRAGWDVTNISSACLLHLEVLVRHPGQPRVESLHLQVMREHLARLRRLYPLSPHTADLHLGLAMDMQGQLKLEDLQLFFDEIGGTFASHGELLQAEGTLHEVLASRRLEPARRAVLAPSTRTSLGNAERLLRQALAVAPDLAEARLRLAHVVVLQGRADEGLGLLQPVLQDPRDSEQRYLAYLFLGQAHTTSGRLELAEQAFAAAAAEGPCGQAAAIALAHLAFRDQRLDAAREILREPLKNAAGCTDPWALYDFGQVTRLTGLITELRRAFRP